LPYAFSTGGKVVYPPFFMSATPELSQAVQKKSRSAFKMVRDKRNR